MRLDRKVIVVTGASSGIGRASAFRFAQEGATVYAVARRGDRLDELAAEAAGLPGRIVPNPADLTIREENVRIVDEAFAAEGKLDVLFNNAGVMDDWSPIGDVTDEMMEKVLALNLYAPLYSSRRAVQLFLEQGYGNIINNSSVGGLQGAKGGAMYTATKHAVIGLTKNTGYLYAKKNIRCNAICAGATKSEIGAGEFISEVNEESAGILMPRLITNPKTATSEEVAEVALFLASDESGALTGSSIVVDYGWSAY